MRELREKSDSKPTQAIASTPTQFHTTFLPERPYLALAQVSSERREYLPIGWVEPPTVPSDKIRLIADATLWGFGVLTSKAHISWAKTVSGRLKSDIQYSANLTYNAFPWPTLSDADKTRLDTLAQAVLDARAAHPGATLADLYDPDVMPADLRRAHRALDLAVDRLYRKAPFDSDRERVEHLFTLYETLTAGLLAKPSRPKRRRTTAA